MSYHQLHNKHFPHLFNCCFTIFTISSKTCTFHFFRCTDALLLSFVMSTSNYKTDCLIFSFLLWFSHLNTVSTLLQYLPNLIQLLESFYFSYAGYFFSFSHTVLMYNVNFSLSQNFYLEMRCLPVTGALIPISFSFKCSSYVPIQNSPPDI